MKKIITYLVLFSLLVNCSERKDHTEKSVGPAQPKEIKQESTDEYNARMRAEALKRNSEKLNDKNTKRKGPVKWYEGGNLHRSKIIDWKRATDENKLVTCADFMAKIQKVSSMDDLLPRSIELRSCINEATRDLESTNSESVADVAVLCVVTLGYK